MPTYILKNSKTGEVKEEMMKISEMEELVKQGEWKTMPAAPNMVTHTGSVLSKTSNNFRDLLGQIKKGAGRRNTIKT